VQHRLSWTVGRSNRSYWLQPEAAEKTGLQLAAMLLAGLWYVVGARWMHGVGGVGCVLRLCVQLLV
jgi:hypothetical protein